MPLHASHLSMYLFITKEGKVLHREEFYPPFPAVRARRMQEEYFPHCELAVLVREDPKEDPKE